MGGHVPPNLTSKMMSSTQRTLGYVMDVQILLTLPFTFFTNVKIIVRKGRTLTYPAQRKLLNSSRQFLQRERKNETKMYEYSY